MYRPEGWKQPNGIGRETPPMAYEAGASAMLEGLERGDYFMRVTDKVVTMPGFEATIDNTVRGAGDGLWVFIPEGKE